MSEEQDATDLLPAGVAEKLKSEFGEVLAVASRSGNAAFRVCKPAEYQRWQELAMDKKTQASATSWFVRACRIYPDPQTFQAWIDRYPGIVSTFASPLLEFCGVETEAQQKKYGNA